MPSRRKIKKKFLAFHRKNPDIYKLFRKYAREVKAAGWSQYSAYAIIERIRWHRDVNTKRAGGFKIPNQYRPLYARRLMRRLPDEFSGFFRTRGPV